MAGSSRGCLCPSRYVIFHRHHPSRRPLGLTRQTIASSTVSQNTDTQQSMGLGGMMNDPFLGSMAGNLLQQQGQSYVSYMQSKMGGVLSGGGGTMAYLFAVTPEYVFQKIAMLLVPFLRRWTYVRQPDPGPHKWEPAATDTNAPDLYIGITALWTYCLLVGVSVFKNEAFSPEIVYSTVSSSIGAWVFHAIVLKSILWALGVSGVSLLELGSYAGYSFVYGCCILLARLASSILGHVLWAYSGFAYSLFLVRTVKSIVRADQKYHYGGPASQNYLLLGLALFEFLLLGYYSWIFSPK